MEVVREEVTKRMSMMTFLINREMTSRLENCKHLCSSFVHLDYFVPYFLVKGSVNVIIFMENFVKNRRKRKYLRRLNEIG